jgi:hypothetical protein
MNEVTQLPGDVWGAVGLAIMVLGGQVGTHLSARRQRRAQTDEVITRLGEGVRDVGDRVDVVAYRLDEHIRASDRAVRGSTGTTGPVSIGERRRKDRQR